MKKITGLLICIMFLQYYSASAQSFSINTTGAAAHASAILDVTSINKGLLIPRLTTAQRTSIASPGKGLLVYDSTLKSFYFHDGINWQQIIIDSNNLWRKNGNDIYKNNTGNVGIGISSPKALLNVRGGAVLFDSTIGNTPVSGAGIRMMWIPAKAAFRAGIVSGTQWDDVNIGDASFATGVNSTASGNSSTAIGTGSTASGAWSIAMGVNSTASWLYSIAMGFNSTASGTQSTAIGNNSIASGDFSAALGGDLATASGNYSIALGYVTIASGMSSTAMGQNTIASGGASTAMGQSTIASGLYSTAMGQGTTASGYLSSAMGYGTKSKSYGGFVTGLYNDSTNAANPININSGNRIFQIGNGLADNARSNAMTVLQNGNVGIGTTTPAYMLTVKNDINVDNGNANAGTTINTLKFGGNGTGEAIGSNRTTAVNQWGLDFYTNYINRMSIANNGYIGIGTTSPVVPLNFAPVLGDKIALWTNGTTHYGFGIQPSLMQIYSESAGTDIAFGYGNSAAFTENARFKGNGNVGIGTNNPNAKLNITASETTANGLGVALQLTNTASANSWTLRAGATGTNTPAGGFSIGDNSLYRLVITSAGNVGINTTTPAAMLDVAGNAAVSTNLTVQSGMGIIRNISGTQLKMLSTAMVVSASLSASGGGVSIGVTWPQSFSAGNIQAFVGNITSGCCFGTLTMSVSNVTVTGATLNVYNPSNTVVNPNFTVNVIAIGPQ